jgi:hypothetical protein
MKGKVRRVEAERENMRRSSPNEEKKTNMQISLLVSVSKSPQLILST